MTPTITASSESSKTPAPFSWVTVSWVSALLLIAYAPVLLALVKQWYQDADMGHGFFVPIFAGYLVWKKSGQNNSNVCSYCQKFRMRKIW